MTRILLILTGGTIGSKVSNGSVDVIKDTDSCLLVDNYLSNSGLIDSDEIYFDIKRPVNILSENMTADAWNDICRCLYDNIVSDYPSRICNDKYDGVIIAHGSDTLSYTSALISILFGAFDIPILLTAANRPLDVLTTNGNTNFMACVDFIKNVHKSGVYTIYQDRFGDIGIYNAHTICEADGFLDDYHDLHGEPLGHMKNGNFTPICPLTSEEEENLRKLQTMCKTLPILSNNVLFIRPYPGINYDAYTFDSYKPAAVLHWLYHAGTAPVITNKLPSSAINFIERCTKENIPVYIAPVKNSKDPAYISNVILIENGARPIYDVNYETAYALLHILTAK